MNYTFAFDGPLSFILCIRYREMSHLALSGRSPSEVLMRRTPRKICSDGIVTARCGNKFHNAYMGPILDASSQASPIPVRSPIFHNETGFKADEHGPSDLPPPWNRENPEFHHNHWSDHHIERCRKSASASNVQTYEWIIIIQ